MRHTIRPETKFNYWTVTGYDNKTKKYECLCVCNNTSLVSSSSLKTGKSKSCGCKQKDSVGKRILKSDFISVKNKIYSNYRRAAERRDYIFSLSKIEFEKIITSNCVYCGLAPSMTYKYGRGNNQAVDYTMFKYNGVDRKDNSIGYILENCVPCCKICNNSKSTLTMEEWQTWLVGIVKFDYFKRFND